MTEEERVYWEQLGRLEHLERLMRNNSVERSIDGLKRAVDEALDIRLRAHIARVDVLVHLADVTLRNLSRKLTELEYYPHKEVTPHGQPAYQAV